MSIGNGTHWEGPLLGSRDLHEDVPVQIQSRRFRTYQFLDFTDAQEDDSWSLTQLVGGGAVTQQSGVNGGITRVVCGAVDAQGLGSWQAGTSIIAGAATGNALDSAQRSISFGCRIRHSDWSIANWFIGLGTFDTTFMGTTGTILTTGADNCVGFHHVVDAVAQGGITGPDGNDLRLVSAGTAVANYQATLLSAAERPFPVPADANIDSVWVELGFRIIGNQNVEFYRDGVLRHRRRMSAVLGAAAQLDLTVAMVSNGTDENFDLDYIWVSAPRSNP